MRGAKSFVLSHPFCDETAKWMGRPEYTSTVVCAIPGPQVRGTWGTPGFSRTN
jgi:hypothetical protein